MKYEQFTAVNIDVDFDSLSVDPQIQACLRLWAAKLVLHVRDYADSIAWQKQKRTNFVREPTHYYTARIWINSDANHIGSFVWVCELFDIDPNYAKRRIKEAYQ